MMRKSKIINGKIYIDGQLWGEVSLPKCELFEFCNCKTAACRSQEPDDSCYWYRYFKKLVEKERKI